MSKPKCARLASARPIRPSPIRPSVLPVTLAPIMWVGPQPCHVPARTSRSPSPARRAIISKSVMAMSAVQSVSTSGVLVTVNPAALAASRSMWLKPTPKLPMMRALRGLAPSTSAEMRSVTVGSSASAARSASCSSATSMRWSSLLSLVSNRSVRRASTAVGQRRVTTTLGLAMALSAGPFGGVSRFRRARRASSRSACRPRRRCCAPPR